MNSLQQQFVISVNSGIDSIIEEFIKKIHNEFNIPVEQLQSLWSGDKKERESVVEPTPEIDDLINANLPGKTVAELKALCTSKGLKKTGKKIDLITRLLGKEPIVKTPKKSSKKAKKENKPKPVLTKLIPNAISVKQNKNGDYKHSPTNLIVCKDTKRVIGRETETGYIPLTKEDIDLCHKFKLEYETPENLGTSDEGIDESLREVEKTIQEELEKYVIPNEEEIIDALSKSSNEDNKPTESEGVIDEEVESDGSYEEYEEYIEEVVVEG